MPTQDAIHSTLSPTEVGQMANDVLYLAGLLEDSTISMFVSIDSTEEMRQRAERIQEIIDRMHAAAEKEDRFAVDEFGRIKALGPFPDEWQAEIAGSGKKPYVVRYDRVSHLLNPKEDGPTKDPAYSCTCMDYMVRRKPNGENCKHIKSIINARGKGVRPPFADDLDPAAYEPLKA